jgi:DNA-binding MarR family transcriptional regulator
MHVYGHPRGDATLTRSLTLLERDGVLERASHPDGRIKAMRLTSKGRRARSDSWDAKEGACDGLDLCKTAIHE